MKKFFVASLIMVMLGLALIAMSAVVYAAAVDQSAQAGGEGQEVAAFSKLGAGIAIGFAACGAGIGLGTASAAAIGVIAEKPEMFGRTMIYIVFIEAIAIYGLVISLLLWMI